MFPIINVFRCDGCGVCIRFCPPQIMGLIHGKAAYLQMLCEECGICADVCPTNGIHFELPARHASTKLDDAYEFKR